MFDYFSHIPSFYIWHVLCSICWWRHCAARCKKEVNVFTKKFRSGVREFDNFTR